MLYAGYVPEHGVELFRVIRNAADALDQVLLAARHAKSCRSVLVRFPQRRLYLVKRNAIGR